MRSDGRTDASFEPLDIVLMERVADLAVFHDKPGIAAEILQVSRSILADAGNVYAADWASLKAASAYLVAGNWSAARAALLYLAPRVGEMESIELTPAGLE